MELTSITPTPAALRALSHPMRLRMLGLLRVDGPATATTLATRLGINTGQTSYHLRQLAQHGFVVEDTERGNARDRWWKAAHSSTMTNKQPDTHDEQESLDAYLQSVVVVNTQHLQAAMEERPLLPLEWREASTFSDYIVRLTPTQARRVVDRLHELLGELDDDTEDEDAADFVVQLNAYPWPGRVGQGGSAQGEPAQGEPAQGESAQGESARGEPS
jgi:DNA-binding transcriptional ArsR family regulator